MAVTEFGENIPLLISLVLFWKTTFSKPLHSKNAFLPMFLTFWGIVIAPTVHEVFRI